MKKREKKKDATVLGTFVLKKSRTDRLNLGQELLLKRENSYLGEWNALNIINYFCYYLGFFIFLIKYLTLIFIENKFCLPNLSYIKKDFTFKKDYPF